MGLAWPFKLCQALMRLGFLQPLLFFNIFSVVRFRRDGDSNAFVARA